MKNDNPLLQKYTLPPFDKIMVRHIEPAINYMIDENRKELKDIIKNTKHRILDIIFFMYFFSVII